MRRTSLSLLLVLAVAFSAVADNAAICCDALGLDATGGGSAPCSDDGPAPAGCGSCPCRLPIVETAALPSLAPLQLSGFSQHPWPASQSLGIGARAPAPPPPLA